MLPSLFLSLFGFLLRSAWVPLPLGRLRSFRFATSLRLSPLSSVFPQTGFRCEIQFSLVALLLVASRLAHCLVSSLHRLALSLDLLSLFEVSSFLCPAQASSLETLLFPPSQFRLPWGFSALWKLISLGLTREALPL